MRAHGIYDIERQNLAKKKMEGRARTVQEPVTAKLWRAHLDGSAGLGIVPIDDDASCRFGAIDIDVYDGLDLKKLERAVRSKKIPLVPCRTKSGGAHLYLFLSEPISATIVRGKLMEWAVVLGFPDVEVFPKQIQLASEEDVGNWINMPYFDAKRKTARYAIWDERPMKAKAFLDLADEIAVDLTGLESIDVGIVAELNGAPPCLQHLASAGFPEGTRNNGLFNLGVFARRRFGDDWEHRIDEMNRRFMDPPLPTREVEGVLKSLRRKKYSYKCNDQPIVSACNRSICLTREHGVGGGGDDPGVVFGGLTKIETRPPTWIVDVDGIRVEIKSTNDLVVQDRFRILCMEKLNRLPNKVKPMAWEKIVQSMLEKIEIIEAPADAGAEGQFVVLLEQFCSERGLARNRDEILLGKPWMDEDKVYFRSADLIRFLDQNRFYEIRTSREAWAVLRKMNAGHGQFNIKKKCVRVWHIPKFDVPEGELDVPRATGEEEF